MTEKLALLLPEVALFITTCVVMVLGLSPALRVRKLCAWVAGLGLVCAGGFAAASPSTSTLFPELLPFGKTLVAIVGIMLLLVLAGTVDRDEDRRAELGAFSALRSTRAEFYSFFLFSLTGLMLVISADDLIWLFLALELTSLPTYIMVTISTRGTKSQEAGVKYFFLGALGAAVFLYGFALLYGAAGSTKLNDIAAVFAESGVSPLGMAGLLVALLGVFFKIAAVPMHFYTADVYQGAASPVSAMLAFVPKMAGFVAIMLLCGTAGWSAIDAGGHIIHSGLPEPIYLLLWIAAAVTMTVGNTLAVLQTSVKRVLAYSSIAHSGYMLVGVLVGPGTAFFENGLAAVLFYLLCYGVMNVGAFAVLASLERRATDAAARAAVEDPTLPAPQPMVEADDFDDIKGLCRRDPMLGWPLVICTLSLLGFPPLLGFIGKFGLFTAGVTAGEIPLVLILGVNSAIAAFYYLKIVATAAFNKPEPTDGFQRTPIPARPIAALVSAGGVIVLLFAAQPLLDSALDAATYNPAAGDVSAEMHEQHIPEAGDASDAVTLRD